MRATRWYKDGLNFKCTGCGKCCTGGPGAVWVSDKEIERFARHLDLSIEEFAKKYLRLINGRPSLIDKPDGSYDCIFLQGKLCTVYEVRPKQCRTYPWWPENLDSPKSWEEAAAECEGINREAPLVMYDEIEAQRERQERKC